MIDPDAPILPYVGLGNISFKCTADELRELLSEATLVWEHEDAARYDIGDVLSLFLMKSHGKLKLFRLMTLEGYTGKLFDKISTSTVEKELLVLEPSFIFDDFEEVFESEKGVFIETDPVSGRARYISVYVKEMDLLEPERFWSGDWW